MLDRKQEGVQSTHLTLDLSMPMPKATVATTTCGVKGGDVGGKQQSRREGAGGGAAGRPPPPAGRRENEGREMAGRCCPHHAASARLPPRRAAAPLACRSTHPLCARGCPSQPTVSLSCMKAACTSARACWLMSAWYAATRPDSPGWRCTRQVRRQRAVQLRQQQWGSYAAMSSPGSAGRVGSRQRCRLLRLPLPPHAAEGKSG